MKKVFPCVCLVSWFVGAYAASAQAEFVFSLRVVKILDADFLEKPCPSCGTAGTSEIPLGEAVPGDSFVIEAFASGWDVAPDSGLCQGGQDCRLSAPRCPDSHCTDTNNSCLSTEQCNEDALCVADKCTPDPVIGAFQFTINASSFRNDFPGGFSVPQLPCDVIACDEENEFFFDGCSCFHGIPFPNSLCTCSAPMPDPSCIPGLCSGGVNQGRPCSSASDCTVCVGGDSDGAPCSRDFDCLGGGLCQVSGETCEDFSRCWLGASAFIDLSRTDYMLGAFASIEAVDVSSEDMAWIAALTQGGIVPEKLGCGGDIDTPCTSNAGCRVCVGGAIAGDVCRFDEDCDVCVGGDNPGLPCLNALVCGGGICNTGGSCPFTGVRCDRIPSYLGTLILQSAACSGGTYSIAFVNDDELTFMNDDDLGRLPAPAVVPAIINLPAVADPCDTFMCDNSDLCRPETCINVGPAGDPCGGPSCEVTPVVCLPDEVCNPADGMCVPDVVDPPCTLIDSSFLCDDTLPRTRNNVLRFTFDCGTGTLPKPLPGDVRIRELLAGGEFGATDLSGSFNINVNGNELVVEEMGGVLTNEVWYGITGMWGTVNQFKRDYVVVYGDVSNGGDTDVTDVTQVLANRSDPAPLDSRFDVNGSTAIDVTDVTITLSNRGSEDPGKPTGHTCTIP